MNATPVKLLPGLETPPHDFLMETYVLGSCLMSAKACGVAFEILSPADFYSPAHVAVFRAIGRLIDAGSGVDPGTVLAELDVDTLERIGGEPYLWKLSEAVPTSKHCQDYARLVAEKALLRRVLSECNRVRAMALDADAAGDYVSESAAAAFSGLWEGAHNRNVWPKVWTGAELETQVFAPLESLVSFDGRAVVPKPGFGLLAGKPKAKKSFLALDLALALASGGCAFGRHPVETAGCLCCFTEDTIEEVQERIRRTETTGWPANLYLVDACPRFDAGGELFLRTQLERDPSIGLVVLDPFINIRGAGRMAEGNLYARDYDDIAVIRRLCREYNVFILIIHHVNKKISDDPFSCISGTRALEGAPDVLYILQTDQEVLTGTLHYKGRRVRGGKRALTWDDRIGWIDEGDATADLEAQSTYADVVQVLKNAGEPKSSGYIVRRLIEDAGASEDTGRQRLKRAKDSGAVSYHQGVYFLPSHMIAVTPVTASQNGSHRHEKSRKTRDTSVTVGLEGVTEPRDTCDAVTPCDAVTVRDSEITDPAEVFTLGLRLGYPQLTLKPGVRVEAGEENWHRAFDAGSEEFRRLMLAAAESYARL